MLKQCQEMLRLGIGALLTSYRLPNRSRLYRRASTLALAREFCRRTRMILFIIGLVFLVVSSQPEFNFLANYDLTNIFAWVVGVLFALLVLWKFYQEYWKNKSEVYSEKKRLIAGNVFIFELLMKPNDPMVAMQWDLSQKSYLVMKFRRLTVISAEASLQRKSKKIRFK